MKPGFRFLVALWTTLCLLGCTSLQPLTDTKPKTVQMAVHLGDEVRLTTKRTGTTYTIKVSRLEPTYLAGYDGTLYVKAPYADLESLSVRQVDGKQVALIGGSVVGITVVVVGGLILIGLLVVRVFSRAADQL